MQNTLSVPFERSYSTTMSEEDDIFVDSSQDLYHGDSDCDGNALRRQLFRSRSCSGRRPQLNSSSRTSTSDTAMGNKVQEVLRRSMSCNPADAHQNRASQRRASEHAQMHNLFAGDVADLPPIPSKTIRIFLSSTFSDFKVERNCLYQNAYPKLKKICSEKGLEFQVLDLRWGVTDDVINDHQVSQLCLDEVVNCQKLSCGPNFVVMLGNRYGYQTFPSKLAENYYCILRDIAQEKNLPHQELLCDWFQLDTNSTEPVYVLQPIPSKLTHYNSDNHPEMRRSHQREWNQIFQNLKTLFRSAVDEAHRRGLVHAEFKKKFYISVTEEEILQGTCANEKISHGLGKDSALCYIRILDGITDSDLPADQLSGYIDLVDDGTGHLDDVAQKLRSELIDQRVYVQLQDNNIKKYRIPWYDGIVESKISNRYLEYLKDFEADFESDVTRQIEIHADRDCEATYGGKGMHGLYTEVLHHAMFTRKKCEVFCGRDELLAQVRQYISGKNQPCSALPLIVHGESGYGKTAFMAKIALSVPEWLRDSGRVVTVIRFMGTSPESTNIQGVLKSLIIQLCYVYKLELPKDESLEKIGDLCREFSNTLNLVSKSEHRKVLVIILDAADQLLSRYSAHKMSWLPRRLPPNVYMVISMLTDRHDCLKNCHHRLKDVATYIELTKMSEAVADEVINCHLDRKQRRITQEQRHLVLDAFNYSQQPLYLKLVLDEAASWHSYTPCSSISVPHDVREMITLFFASLETKYGEVFVRHALAYLTCGRSGLSCVEMEDVLSCDDHVLNCVYQYHDPPIEGIIRLPCLMWARLQNDLKEYLAQRYVDSKNVFTWYHRQFWEAAEERYLNNETKKRMYHSALADIFIQEQGVFRTIILTQRGHKIIENANRCVTPQPMCIRNTRKINCIPYHLFRAERYEDLKALSMVNFNWLYYKLTSQGISRLLRDYEFWCEKSSELAADNNEVLLMCDFLQQCYNALTYNSLLLAVNIKERISTSCLDGKPLLRKLVIDADNWLAGTNKPLLVPAIPLELPPVDSPLRLNLLAGKDGILDKDGKFVVCQWIEKNPTISKLKTLSLRTRDIIASVDLEKPGAPYVLTPDSKHIIYPGIDSIHVCEADTGDLLHKFAYHTRRGDLTLRCLALDDQCNYVAVGVRYEKPKNGRGNNWKRQTHIFIVDYKQQKQVGAAKVNARQHVQNLHFVRCQESATEEKLLALFKDKVIVYDVPNMAELHILQNLGEMHQHISTVCHTSHHLIAGVSKDGFAKLLYFNYRSHQHTYSGALNAKQQSSSVKLQTDHFGVWCSSDGSSIIVGHSTPKAADMTLQHVLTQLRLGQQKRPTIDISLMGNGSKACSLCVDSKATKAFVGWHDGNITIIDLESARQVKHFQAHHHNINDIKLLDEDQKLLTFSQDHSVKMWDIDALCASCPVITVRQDSGIYSPDDSSQEMEIDDPEGGVVKQTDRPLSRNNSQNSLCAFKNGSNWNNLPIPRQVSNTRSISTTSRESGFSSPSFDMLQPGFSVDHVDSNQGIDTIPEVSDNNNKLYRLQEAEECLNMCISDDLLMTCPSSSEEVCKLWNVDDGMLVPKYYKLNADYKTLLGGQEFKYDTKSHAVVSYLGPYQNKDLVVYERKQRNSLCVYCSLLDRGDGAEIASHKIFYDTYKRLIYRWNSQDNLLTGETDEYRIAIMKNGCLEICSLPDFTLLKSINIPPITADMPDIKSAAGKRRLSCLKLAITLDARYFVIANTLTTQKYVDLIDLQTEQYVERISLMKEVHQVFLSDGIYSLVFFDNDEVEMGAKKGMPDKTVIKTSFIDQLDSLKCCYKYICSLYIDATLMSYDRTLGLEIDNYSNVVSLWDLFKVAKVHVFEGHLHDITTADISHNNRYVATGSYDKTARIWSVTSGKCLCLFHSAGAVDQVRFSPSFKYLACLCYAAPQRKRALLLKIKNIK